MTEEERFAKAVAALDLPSWEHVGAFLISQGIAESDSGGNSLWYACRCPIAQYLQRSGFPQAVVGTVNVWMTKEKGEILLPASAVEFISIHDGQRK